MRTNFLLLRVKIFTSYLDARSLASPCSYFGVLHKQPRTGALTIPNISRQFAAVNSRNFFSTTFFKSLTMSSLHFTPFFTFSLWVSCPKWYYFVLYLVLFSELSSSAIVPIPTTVGRTKERLEAISSVTFL